MSSAEDILRAKKLQQAKGNERFADRSKQHLMDIAEKKFRTTFIFALSEFEKMFGGELFGHGLDEEEIDSVQKQNRKKWQQVRTNILNKGHAQSRGLVGEMALYDIQFRGYEYGMTVEGKDGNQSR